MSEYAKAPAPAPHRRNLSVVIVAQFVLMIAFWALVVAGLIDHDRIWVWWRLALGVVGLKLGAFATYRFIDKGQRAPRQRLRALLELVLAAGAVVLALRGL